MDVATDGVREGEIGCLSDEMRISSGRSNDRTGCAGWAEARQDAGALRLESRL
jgi:hypothetical protein